MCLLFLFLTLNTVSGQQLSYEQYLDHPWVDSMLSELSREEMIAQLRWVPVGPDDGLQKLMEVAGSVKDCGLGGLIFRAAPGEQMLEFAAYCRSVSPMPLPLVLEGRWSEEYPDTKVLGSITSDSMRYLAGLNLASQIREKGISLILADGMDKTLASGLADGHVQVLHPDWMQAGTLQDTVRKVLALKYWIQEEQAGAVEGRYAEKYPGGSGQRAFTRELYARSLTVLRNQEEVIPVKDLASTRIACLVVNQEHLTEFQKTVALYTQTDDYFWSPGSDASEELSKKLASYDLVLLGMYPGQYGEETQAFLSTLKPAAKLVAVWFGDPASLQELHGVASGDPTAELQGLILANEQNPFTENLSAQLIFGAVGGRGRLAVALGDQYPGGHGISTPGGIRLQYGFPENAGLCSGHLNQAIDSIVQRGLEAGAYPGCQVIVARKGIVVFHRAYGYHSYDRRIKVRKNDLYDLASVTKISGPLSGLMVLEGMGKFSYQDRLGDYCGAMKGSDKADLALKDILAHRAGLFPWIPYHEKTLKKNGQYKKRFIRPDADDKFSIQVADRLYLSNTYKKKIFKEIRKSELGEQKYLYSGLSFFLFPTIIEELSGQPYETFLSENIYHRLGAWELLYHPRDTYPGSRIVPTEIDSLFRKQLVHGYVHDEGAALMGAYAGNAGLFASSNDLLKLIEMYRRMGSYGGEQIIQEEVLKEYSSYQFPELKIRRGLGFDKPLLNENNGTPEDYPCPGASPVSFGHSGFTGTFVWADPEHEISYVFLCNRVHTTRTNQLLYNMNIRTNILQSVIDSIIEP